jgi:hypothetical protein
MTPLSPNNRMRRSGHDKVHAPNCIARFGISDQASQDRRAVSHEGDFVALALGGA